MPGRIDSLVLKVAERCNLNCSYCYMYQHADQSFARRPVFMSDEVFEAVLHRVVEYCEQHPPGRMWLGLHGGEPTLIGPGRLDRLAQRARVVLGPHLAGFSMQTNATLIDQDWITVLRANEIRIGVSLDGPAHMHDMFRVDHSGLGSHSAAVRGLRLLQTAGLSPGVLCVINPGASGLLCYRYFRSIEIQRMNFLFPDVTHESSRRFYGRYGGTPVADYLIPIFDEWFGQDDPTVRISLFWELMRRLMGREPEGDAFGNPLMSYLVVDTDGTIQALDALKVCEENIAESGLNVLANGFDDLQFGLPLVHRMVHLGIPLSAECQRCPERSLCAGGYVPHRYSKAAGFDNPSVWCKDILRLLAHIRSRVAPFGAAAGYAEIARAGSSE